jgi:5-methylcytosine-specific restriction endonuclease McrA
MKPKLLDVLKTDALAQQIDDGWETRCLHCKRRHRFTATGVALSNASIEHIVPQAWFNKRAASALTNVLSGPEDLRNLAIACAGCNHSKGRGPDAAGPSDSRARNIIERLFAQRQTRFRSTAET